MATGVLKRTETGHPVRNFLPEDEGNLKIELQKNRRVRRGKVKYGILDAGQIIDNLVPIKDPYRMTHNNYVI